MVATTGLAVGTGQAASAGRGGRRRRAGLHLEFIVVDRSAILRASKVGQDIVRQVNGLTQTAETQFRARKRRTGEGVADASAADRHLAPDVRAQKIRAFQSKEAAFKQKVQTRQDQNPGRPAQGTPTVEQALAPILQGIMQERGANLLLDRAAVVLGMVDVT